jgi:hypothetical protein
VTTVDPVFDLKGVWHDVNPAIDARLLDRLRTLRDGPTEILWVDLTKTSQGQADGVRAALGHVGGYIDPHWFAGDGKHQDLLGQALPDPIVFRKTATALVAKSFRAGDPVCFDFEKIPPQWVKDFLWGRASDASSGWRGKGGQRTGGTNPSRPSAWTDASYQVGNFAAVIPDYVAAGFVLYVQLYFGNMDPVSDPVWAMLEPVYAGFPARAVKPCYDGARYPFGWPARLGGVLFSSQRIVSLFTVRRRLALAVRKPARD